MDFFLLFLLNILAMVLIYLVLRRFVEKRFSSKGFVEEVQQEVGKIITEMNQTTERNIQVIEHHLEELKKISQRAENLVVSASREVTLQEERVHKYRKLAMPAANTAAKYAAGDPASAAPQTAATRSGAGDESVPAAEVKPAAAPGEELAAPKQNHPKQSDREQKKTLARELYMRGADLPEISEATGLSLAEVELIIALIRR